MKKILVLRGGAIGDFVVTLPALSALRAQYPSATITLVGHPRTNSLAVDAGLVDTALSLDSRDTSGLFAQDMTDDSILGGSLCQADAVISYLHDPEGIVTANLLSLNSRVVCQSPIPDGMHMVDQLLRPLAELGIATNESVQPHLAISADARERGLRRAADIGEHIIAVHPGSGSPSKNWPAKRFAELAKKAAKDLSLQPVFFFGEADTAVQNELAELVADINTVSDASLLELASLLSACAGFVGNDSGITHLAAAVGTPTIAMFGPSNHHVWAPRGEHVTILASNERTPESLAEISVEEVFSMLVQSATGMGSTSSSGSG